MMARYHLFQPHCIAGVYYEPGIVDLPTSWVPTPNCEPLDTDATNAFYAAGPTGRVGGGQTYWIASALPGNPSDAVAGQAQTGGKPIPNPVRE